MTETESDTESDLMPERWMLEPMAIVFAVTIIHAVGMILGYYRGFYAKTDLALQAQKVMIVAIILAMLLAAFHPAERENHD